MSKRKWTLWHGTLAWAAAGVLCLVAMKFGFESMRGLAAFFFAIAFIFVVVDMILDDIERRWPRDK